jgi:hypothetical protein
MKLLFIAAICLGSATAVAQHSPYAGDESREIKALSGTQVKQYLEGAGMGYAKAAELNRHPGPMHALELADKIGLTPGQVRATQALMSAHKAQARDIGKRLVQAERELDSLFRTGNTDQPSLQRAVRNAAGLEGEYRLSHLETHRRLRALLTEDQVARYDQLRGYSGKSGHDHGGHSK